MADYRKVLAALEIGRKRIESPEAWTQDAFARDASYAEVEPDDPAAVCWCAEGAVPEYDSDTAAAARAELDMATGDAGLITAAGFNDRASTTHADVLALFGRAIANVRARLEAAP